MCTLIKLIKLNYWLYLIRFFFHQSNHKTQRVRQLISLSMSLISSIFSHSFFSWKITAWISVFFFPSVFLTLEPRVLLCVASTLRIMRISYTLCEFFDSPRVCPCCLYGRLASARQNVNKYSKTCDFYSTCEYIISLG